MAPGVGQRCESTGTTNKRLARKILDMRRAEIVEGRYVKLVKSQAPSLKDFCRQYIESRKDLSPNTRKRYECSERNLVKFFGDSLLSDITETRIDSYKQSQLGAGVHAAGVNRNLSLLRLVLKKARRERYIAQNPLNDSELFMNERKERLQAKPFSLEEEQKLLAVAKGYLRPLIVLLLDTGLRVGKEALPLRWADLDLLNGVVYVRQSKTQAGIRSLPMTARLKAELARWKQLMGKQSDFVFAYPLDQSKHLLQVPKTWARALKDAKVEPRRIYDLRSTFATRLNAAGVPQVFIDQLMGHSGGLAQTYSKAIDEYRRAAIDKLEAFILSKTADVNMPALSQKWVN
ncbi:MAG TPA: tyrosine-type recombinase/integrase [Verrucomicrobiae bacterium]|nr:tyrosine-type recombinase/integrase [Verrucomicrobiae bacterium]